VAGIVGGAGARATSPATTISWTCDASNGLIPLLRAASVALAPSGRIAVPRTFSIPPAVIGGRAKRVPQPFDRTWPTGSRRRDTAAVFPPVDQQQPADRRPPRWCNRRHAGRSPASPLLMMKLGQGIERGMTDLPRWCSDQPTTSKGAKVISSPDSQGSQFPTPGSADGAINMNEATVQPRSAMIWLSSH